MRLVMLGPPAAGKGTQGKLLASSYDIPHISTGSMFRESMLAENEMGHQVRQCMERGELVPDSLAITVVKMRLSQPDCRKGFVLDGFPRTVPQAESLESALHQLGMRLNAVVNIRIPETESIRRISSRRVCQDCGANSKVPGEVCQACGGHLVQRPDDTPETARTRLEVYRKQTEPVLAYYRLQGRLISVDGEQPVDEVFALVTSQLQSICHHEEACARNGVAE